MESQGSAAKGREEEELEMIGGIDMWSKEEEEWSLPFHRVCLL